jgi:four helix bundle protein
MGRSYRDFGAWQKAMQLSVKVYELTSGFPREEQYGLTSQMRRASVSVISNIAEGHGRDSRPQLMQFLSMARGSVFEVEAQLLLCSELHMGQDNLVQGCQALCDEVSRMLYSALRALRLQDAEEVGS